ncbi:hypothetical protein, partial [Burkholderia sp. RF2-non_BP3]|uniref:hypothetical protein n=1 Tax=Burkholderia sp. RF2-non_BP3 TaxID=1637844 RepID=UPI001C54D860
RPLDPLFQLPPLRLGEKVSTYFRTGQCHEKSRRARSTAAFFVGCAALCQATRSPVGAVPSGA